MYIHIYTQQHLAEQVLYEAYTHTSANKCVRGYCAVCLMSEPTHHFLLQLRTQSVEQSAELQSGALLWEIKCV